MVRTYRAFQFFASACIAGGLAIGTAEAKSNTAPVAVKVAVPASAAAAPSVVEAIIAAPAANTVAPACARRVKVVYSGYGEGDRASCAIASSDVAR